MIITLHDRPLLISLQRWWLEFWRVLSARNTSRHDTVQIAGAMGRHAETRERYSREPSQAQAAWVGYTERDQDDGPTKRRPPLSVQKSFEFKASPYEQDIRNQRGRGLQPLVPSWSAWYMEWAAVLPFSILTRERFYKLVTGFPSLKCPLVPANIVYSNFWSIYFLSGYKFFDCFFKS